MGRIDQRAREIVRVDLPPLVVEVLEDLLADDPLFDLDVGEERLAQELAEVRRRLVAA
jgi:hypothetical protein